MTPLALLDACVLVPQRLSSVILTLAEEGMFEPRWSEVILDETERALIGPKLGLPPDRARRRLNAMRTAFPEAPVAGWESLTPGLTCDRKDRHVLAAAIAGGVDLLVTNNVTDFPAESCDPYDLDVVDADTFLLMLLADDPPACRAAIAREADRLRAPARTVTQLLAGLTKVTPTFAQVVHNFWAELEQPLSDVPAYVLSDDDRGPLGDFAREPQLTDPLHAAFLWSIALGDRHHDPELLKAMTWSPSAFGDWKWADELMSKCSFASRVWDAVDDPTGHVKFVRLVPAVAQPSRTFGAFIVRGGAQYLIMKKRLNGNWCVWGLGNRLVAAADVLEG